MAITYLGLSYLDCMAIEPCDILGYIDSKKEQYRLESYMQSIAVINGVSKIFSKDAKFIDIFEEKRKELTQEEADRERNELLAFRRKGSEK